MTPDALKHTRLASGLTLAEVGRESGFSLSTVWRFEEGAIPLHADAERRLRRALLALVARRQHALTETLTTLAAVSS